MKTDRFDSGNFIQQFFLYSFDMSKNKNYLNQFGNKIKGGFTRCVLVIRTSH